MKKLELSARDTCSYTLIGMPEITIDMEQRKRKERGINQMIQVNKSSKNENRAELNKMHLFHNLGHLVNQFINFSFCCYFLLF